MSVTSTVDARCSARCAAGFRAQLPARLAASASSSREDAASFRRPGQPQQICSNVCSTSMFMKITTLKDSCSSCLDFYLVLVKAIEILSDSNASILWPLQNDEVRFIPLQALHARSSEEEKTQLCENAIDSSAARPPRADASALSKLNSWRLLKLIKIKSKLIK